MDLHRAWLFLADRSVDYSDRARTRIIRRGDSLGQLPMQGRALPGSTTRLLSIPDIQHVIDYRIEDDVIRILRVRSTAQDRTE